MSERDSSSPDSNRNTRFGKVPASGGKPETGDTPAAKPPQPLESARARGPHVTSEDAERRRLASVAFGSAGAGEEAHCGCPECGHQIAIGTNDAGQRLICPSCGAGVQAPAIPVGGGIQASGGGRGVSRPASLPQRRPETPDEVAESRESRLALDERHRLNPGRTPKFTPLEGAAPSAYGDSDGGWAGSSAGYSAGRSGRLTFLLGLLAAMAVAGGIFAFLLLTKAAPSDAPITDSNAELSPEIRNLLAFYQKFRDAKSPEDRASFVRHPGITLPRMQSYYQLRGMDPPSPLLFPLTATPLTVDSVDFVRCDGQFKSQTISVWFEKIGDDAFLVDWESLVGFADTEWDLYLAGSPTGEREFRVFIKPEEHYAGDFQDSAKFSCARLSHVDSNEKLYAYALRDSEVDKTMASLLSEAGNKFGRPSACRVRVRFTRPGTSGRQVELLAIAPGWVTEETAPVITADLPPAPEIDEPGLSGLEKPGDGAESGERPPRPVPDAGAESDAESDADDSDEIPRAVRSGTSSKDGAREAIIPSAIPIEPGVGNENAGEPVREASGPMP